MPTVILSTAARYTLPLLLLFSIFVLFRGHNDPGGGFVGGLVASAAVTLYVLAYGVEKAQKVLPIDCRRMMAIGLLVAVSSGLLSMLVGKPFMTGLWPSTDMFSSTESVADSDSHNASDDQTKDSAITNETKIKNDHSTGDDGHGKGGELISLPLVGKPGTPLMFDIGVYLVVIGVTLTIIFQLAENL